VAVDFLPDQAVNASMTRLSGYLSEGSLRPLPQVVHSISAVRAALRQMSQARHVGKIVVRTHTLQQDHSSSPGAAIVCGGLGMIGSLVASWLAKQSIQRIVLLGRSGRPSADSSGAIALALGGATAVVTMARCDASSSEDVRVMSRQSCVDVGVQAVFHSGGVLADATLLNQRPGGIRDVVAPKLNSAQLWERTVGLHPSTMHVAFSSVAALLGSPGQANYSAANAMLDALSESWQSQGSPGLSIQWGAWAEGGMAAANAGTAMAVERMGMGMVRPQEGIGAMQALLMQSAAASIAVNAAVPFHWTRFLGRMKNVPPMFSEYSAFWVGPDDTTETAAGATQTSSAANTPAVGGVHGRRAAERKPSSATAATAVSADAVVDQVHESVKSVLGSAVGADDALMAAGLDSLGSVELKNALERRSGIELPSTLVFDYPTVNALAGFLAVKLSSSAPKDEGGAVDEDEFDTLGMFYGDNYVAPTLLYDNAVPPSPQLVGVKSVTVRSARDALNQLSPADCPSSVPVGRWDVEAQSELCGGIPVMFGVFLGDVAAFDAAAFTLSDTEAALMDPQQRLLLETVAEAALPHSKILADDALRADWGVFVVGIITFLFKIAMNLGSLLSHPCCLIRVCVY